MATENHEELSAYLDGEVSEDEKRGIEAKLAGDRDCAQALERLRAVRNTMQGCIKEPSFHARLMERIEAEEQRLVKRRAVLRRSGLAAAAAAGVVCVVLAYWVVERGEPSIVSPDHEVAVLPTAGELAPGASTGPSATPSPEQEQGLSPAMDATELGLELAGTLIGPTPMAILVIPDGDERKQKAFKVGDTIREGVTLLEVRSREVVINNHGRVEVLAKIRPPQSPGPPIDGQWALALHDSRGQPVPTGEVFSLKCANQSLQLLLENKPVAYGSLKASQVLLTVPEPHEYAGEFEGEFDEGWTKLVLRQAGATEVAAELTRMSEDSRDALVAEQSTTEQCIRELKAMFAVLENYARDHEGKFPSTLQELAARNVLDLAMFENTETRTVRYFPNALSSRPEYAQLAFIALDAIEPSLPYPDRLMAWEKALEANRYRAYLFPKAVLEVTYIELGKKFTVDAWGAVCEPMGPESTVRSAEMRAGCQNNLKQIGLLIKMFESENEGYTPPGWLCLYPEYLTVPSILRSPKDPPGTDSYLYLFPATNVKELVRQRIEELGESNNPARPAQLESELPLAMNRTDFPGPAPGRNVLFADGHVEYIKRSDWPSRVANSVWRDEIPPHLRNW